MSPDLQFKILIVATAFLVIVWIVGRVRRILRKRKPPRIHPKLEKYQPAEDVAAMRRQEAERILATSSGSEIVGYRIIRQIEAVFVDGFRKPEEAIEGLKAVAAMKGANAVANVRQTPAGMGRYSAAGDAIVVQSTQENESVAEGDSEDEGSS